MARGYGAVPGPFRVYLISPDETLILDLELPPDAAGTVRLDVAAGLPGVRGVELATGTGREALLPSGPAIPVPPTVRRERATAGTIFVTREPAGGLQVSARNLAFPGGRSIDVAPRPVALSTYPPGPALPGGR